MAFTDQSVVQKVCETGPDAREALDYLLFTLCHDAVVFYSRRGGYEYDELMQEVCLRLLGRKHDWGPLRSWNGNSRLKTFLSVVVRNLHFDRMRRLRRDLLLGRPKRLDEVGDISNEKERRSSEEAVEREFRIWRIKAAMDNLTEQERRVIELSFEGRWAQEIADELHITVGHVGVIKLRAIKKLREALKGGNDDAIPN